MPRKIITFDEDKCNDCGLYMTVCPAEVIEETEGDW